MRLRISVLAALVSISALFGSAGPASGVDRATTARVHELEGRITSVNATNRTFGLHTRSRGTVRIHVTRSTRYEDLSGHFRALHRGLRVEVKARRVSGEWRATEVDGEDAG